MIKNLSEYFLEEQEYYLKEIEYKKIDENLDDGVECTLNCIDNINVEVIADKQTIVTVTRTLKFDTQNIFLLKVAFGAVLKFDRQKVKEHDWHNMNMAAEFKENGAFVLNNLMSRISLQIAQITSSYGQVPLILPPAIAQGTQK